MRILLTNNRLDVRGGAETFLADLARGLQVEGHTVLVFGSDLGAKERMFEIDRLPVATDLENLPFQPDLIHGQHHLNTMNAVLSLPGVPAIYHCHGATWKEAIPAHPRLYRYFAASPTLAERIKAESNLADDRVEVFFNGVDLDRFRTVRELPAKPLRALFYNSYHKPGSPAFEAARWGAEKCGLSFDIISQHTNNLVTDPENVLPQYDLVFASGRSAIDAIVSGCAVVILGREGVGPLVTTDNYPKSRSANFAIAGNAPPLSPAQVAEEIDRYSAADAAAVTKQLRNDADSRALVKRMIASYEQVIAEHATTEPDLHAEMAATAHYFRRIVPIIQLVDKAQKEAGYSMQLADTLETLSRQLGDVQGEISEALSLPRIRKGGEEETKSAES